MNTIETLFVPGLPSAAKHPTILKKFDALQNGEAFLLVNDHDPIPLYYEMKAEMGATLIWNKIEDGPEVWKVEITKIYTHTRSNSSKEADASCSIIAVEGEKKEVIPVLNVTLIEPRLKHPTIFKQFDALPEGEAFEILNDHDPKPLYYQMIGERGNTFSWTYLEKGPDWWRVRIKKNDAQKGETIGQIAAKDVRKAEVFKRFGIDFCCGGKKTLAQVCEEKGLDPKQVEAELENPQLSIESAHDFNRWEPDFLADYIYNQHHLYYYGEINSIVEVMAKVAAHHGATHPELKALQQLFARLKSELDTHFLREEKVVFPFIKGLVVAQKTGNFEALNSQPSLTEPIQMMESDHEAAGDLLDEIKRLTNGYQPPVDACNSYQFLYKKLMELDNDLHTHIHLENNLLFPKALKLEKSLRLV